MSIGEIVAAISTGALFLGTFIEVSKIKINPWSSLFGWIGNKMMAGVKEEMKEIRKEQEELAKKQEELAIQRAIDAADNIKAEIFNFYNECQREQRHSEAEFIYIIQQNKKYEELLKVTNDPNGVYEAEYEYILQIFHKCQEEKDFYVGGETGEAKQSRAQGA